MKKELALNINRILISSELSKRTKDSKNRMSLWKRKKYAMSGKESVSMEEV